MYGLTINTGHVARYDRNARLAYCYQLGRDFDAGLVTDDAVYLVNPPLVERFRATAQRPIVCSQIDTIPTCVTESSYASWKAEREFR